MAIHYKGRYYDGVEYNLALLYMDKIISGTITNEECRRILSGKINLVYTIRSTKTVKPLVRG